MEPSSPILHRPRRLCYYKVDPRAIDSDLMMIESHLKRLGDLKVEAVKDLSSLEVLPCDLIVVGAQKVPEDAFSGWFSALRAKLVSNASIWTPALVIADVSFDVLRSLLVQAVLDNWYFDIVNPRQISSLPIRVANLLRIHDHLHELRRYALALDEIQGQVRELESQIVTLDQNRSQS